MRTLVTAWAGVRAWFPGAVMLGAASIAALLISPHAQAAAAAETLRWITADDVRMRTGSGPGFTIATTLSRGTEVELQDGYEREGYCLIGVKGRNGFNGFVTCKYLSAAPIARPRAGENGVPSSQRWVSGRGVMLRAAPRPDAAVAGRLADNSVVKLLTEDDGSGYCEVQTAGRMRAYTACRYLAVSPIDLSRIRAQYKQDWTPNLEYDPERAFWLGPNWEDLYKYAVRLVERQPTLPREGPWPRDPALERMKAHLALGMKGAKPPPFPDWSEVKRIAATREPAVTDVPLFDATHAINASLIRALEFPSVRPSLFRSEAEVAPPHEKTEQASGRFDIVYRQVVTPRPKPKKGEEGGSYGVYDMLARTTVLVQPVKRVRLFRDGRLSAESSFVRHKETLWGDLDAPMCHDFTEGFTFGDADSSIWRFFGEGATHHKTSNPNPAGSLYAFYSAIDLPQGRATRAVTTTKMTVTDTGFVRGTHLYYDLDGDGIHDLAVWEGQGKGGYMEKTKTDDRNFRLVLININGRWKVLGIDSFGYGCGC